MNFFRKLLSKPVALELTGPSGPTLNDSLIAAAEQNLGVKLPGAYLSLLRRQNGGSLNDEWFTTKQGFEFECQEIPGLGYPEGIDGEFGSNYIIEEWQYPEGVIYLTGDGHTGVCFDYRKCGSQGEPTIIWVDKESEEEHQIAPNFAAFLKIVSKPQEE